MFRYKLLVFFFSHLPRLLYLFTAEECDGLKLLQMYSLTHFRERIDYYVVWLCILEMVQIKYSNMIFMYLFKLIGIKLWYLSIWLCLFVCFNCKSSLVDFFKSCLHFHPFWMYNALIFQSPCCVFSSVESQPHWHWYSFKKDKWQGSKFGLND